MRYINSVAKYHATELKVRILTSNMHYGIRTKCVLCAHGRGKHALQRFVIHTCKSACWEDGTEKAIWIPFKYFAHFIEIFVIYYEVLCSKSRRHFLFTEIDFRIRWHFLTCILPLGNLKKKIAIFTFYPIWLK